MPHLFDFFSLTRKPLSFHLPFSVHDDVQLCQWLRTQDGTIKLGDFNRAEIMDFNMEKKEYCRYNNGHAYGNVSKIALMLRAKFASVGKV